MTPEQIRQKIYARTGNFVPEIVAEAVLELIGAEREACANICENDWSNVAEKMYGKDCADAIRARKP